ncbi:MAG: hypothetical protein WCS42_13565 [Verrucomicrobiota bacterium]
MNQAILSGLIYRFKRGAATAHTKDPRRYNCLSPAEDWSETIHTGDVWLVDCRGNIDPGNNNSPVPVRREQIGTLIGRMP